MKNSLVKMDAARAAELQKLKADLEKKLKKSNEEKRALKKSIQEMHTKEEKVWRKKIRTLVKQFLEELAANEQDLRDIEESLREIRKDMVRRRRPQSRR